MNVGHLEYTSWFGENGNILLAGHSLSLAGQPDIFYHLDLVQVGDEITIQDNGTSYRYIVSQTFTIEETDLSIINPTSVETLTLFTCDTSSYSDGAYRRRHVVLAVRG